MLYIAILYEQWYNVNVTFILFLQFEIGSYI